MPKILASTRPLSKIKNFSASKTNNEKNLGNTAKYHENNGLAALHDETFSGIDIKDIVMVSNYKVAVARAQIEALSEILIRSKIMTYEEFWKLTNEKIKDLKM